MDSRITWAWGKAMRTQKQEAVKKETDALDCRNIDKFCVVQNTINNQKIDNELEGSIGKITQIRALIVPKYKELLKIGERHE